MIRSSTLVALALATACGCDRSSTSTKGARKSNAGTAVARTDRVVAVVGGRAIHVEEVGAAARERGVSPIEALRQLEAEELLFAEATRRGYDSKVSTTVARAAVQALLEREIESKTPASAEARWARLRAFLRELEHARPVVRNEEAIKRAVAAPLDRE